MPKRVLDGEAVWRSEKLSRVQPEKVRAEYMNLVPLALANGVFEAEPRIVWATVYSFNRPDISPANVAEFLAEFERVGMLFRWRDENGKAWGYWVGIEKPGRLPPASRVKNRHQLLGPEPAKAGLEKYVADHRLATGQSTASQQVVNGSLGGGRGSGLGSGTGERTENRSLSSFKPSVQSRAAEPSSSAQAPHEVRGDSLLPDVSPSAMDLAQLLRQRILENNPRSKRISEKTLVAWAHEAELMARVDRRTFEEIRGLIEWSQADGFWRGVILSMGKLRKQFDQLILRSKSEGRKNGKPKKPGGDTTGEHLERLRRNAKLLGLDHS